MITEIRHRIETIRRKYEQIRQDEEFLADEWRMQQLVELAVEAVNVVVVEGSDGSHEETAWLTAAIARKLVDQALMPFNSDYLRSRLFGRADSAHAEQPQPASIAAEKR